MTVPRIVTIGGGHGQATLVSALVRLRCEVTALVSVADDGGCSGRLREELGMPPPGDIRRCLVALSTRPKLAARFDERLPDVIDEDALYPVGYHEARRSAGNLVLAEMSQRLGGLQLAVDWAARLLGCVGRVVPIAETAGVLHAYDATKGALSGESNIERESARTIAVNVEGPETANPEAKRALASADFVFIGPGSFVGSTLAALTTGDIAAAIERARARKVLVQNLEREKGSSYGVEEHPRIVRDHLLIKSDGGPIALDVLAHLASGMNETPRLDGSMEYYAPLTRPDQTTHDEELLAQAIAAHFKLLPTGPRSRPDVRQAEEVAALARFDDTLRAARQRLSRLTTS